MPVPLHILITWYQTGDKPTGEQYEQLITSLAHKDDLEAIINLLDSKADNNAIASLLPQVLIGQTSVAISAGTLIQKILVIGTAGAVISVGTSVGNNDVIEGLQVTDQGWATQATDLYFPSNTTLHFTGTNSQTIIKIYK